MKKTLLILGILGIVLMSGCITHPNQKATRIIKTSELTNNNKKLLQLTVEVYDLNTSTSKLEELISYEYNGIDWKVKTTPTSTTTTIMTLGRKAEKESLIFDNAVKYLECIAWNKYPATKEGKINCNYYYDKCNETLIPDGRVHLGGKNECYGFYILTDNWTKEFQEEEGHYYREFDRDNCYDNSYPVYFDFMDIPRGEIYYLVCC